MDAAAARPGRILEITGDCGLYDLAVYEKKQKAWSWPGAQPDGAPVAPPPKVAASRPDQICRLAPGALVRVERLLFDARAVKGSSGQLQVLEVTADGGPGRGFVFSVFEGKPYAALAGLRIEVEAGKSRTFDGAVGPTALGAVIGAWPPPVVAPVPAHAPQVGGDEARKYELLKALVLASRRWDRVGKWSPSDYESGKGATPPVFHEAPWEPNMVGLRAWADGKGVTDPRAGTYNATLYVLYKDGGGTPRCEHFRTAFDCAPPTDGTPAAEDYAGTSDVLPGQYVFHQDCHPDFYRAGEFRFPALDHDPHGLWYFERSKRKGGPKNILSGGSGIHFHSGRAQDSCRHTTIGCQIFWNTWTNWRYQRFLWLMSRGPDGRFLQDRVREKTYTLVDARRVDRGTLDALKALKPDEAEIKARAQQQGEKIGLKAYARSSADRFIWKVVDSFPAGTAAPGT